MTDSDIVRQSEGCRGEGLLWGGASADPASLVSSWRRSLRPRRPSCLKARFLGAMLLWFDDPVESLLGGARLGPQFGSVCVAEVQSRYVRAPRDSADEC